MVAKRLLETEEVEFAGDAVEFAGDAVELAGEAVELARRRASLGELNTNGSRNPAVVKTNRQKWSRTRGETN